MKYLFPNFLNNWEEFVKSQYYWLRLCWEILEKNQQAKNWIVCGEMLQHELGVLDSFGIVGGFNFEKTKGIGITQRDPKGYTELEIVSYTAESDKFSDTQPIIYLEFTCNLSEESAAIFKQLFEKWIQPDCTTEEIEKFIESLDSVNKPNN
jgi:hypothetical protein